MDRTSFTITASQAELDDLASRLDRTRFPDSVSGAGWSYGTDLDYLRELVRYWRERYDWRAQERELNRLEHYRATIDGHGLHFIHARGKGERPLPILLSHGFPDSFTRMWKLIPRLTDPAAYGGDPADAFDVVVPSLPGFGFSERPSTPGFGVARIAALFAQLMGGLGYTRYGAHGGDWGSGVTEQLAIQDAAHVVGIHLTDIPFWRLFTLPPRDLTPAEQSYLDSGRKWQRAEGGYFAIQATKPQTLAVGLNDSPAGLASWIVEKFRAWSDCDGDVERRFSKDELLTNVMIYWLTQTIHSAARTYYEAQHAPHLAAPGRVEVPTGVAFFPKDLVRAPREYAERFFDVRRWTEPPRGGHFAAHEEPDVLAHELREFFRPLR